MTDSIIPIGARLAAARQEIDDWEKYRHLWIEAGGVWITHRSAAETAEELARLGL